MTNDLQIERNIQKNEKRNEAKRNEESLRDKKLIVQFVDDDEHLIFEFEKERQRRLFAKTTHDDDNENETRSERRVYERNIKILYTEIRRRRNKSTM